jgi:putative flippase GtrA
MSFMLRKGNSLLQELRKMILYAGNGFINLIVTYALFLVLSNYIDYRLTIIIVYIPGIFLSFFLNGRITFKNNGHFIIFILICLLQLATNIAITWTLVEVFHMLKGISQLIAIGLVFFLGYSLNRRYTFADKYKKRKMAQR